jgi:hypothetical protein
MARCEKVSEKARDLPRQDRLRQHTGRWGVLAVVRVPGTAVAITLATSAGHRPRPERGGKGGGLFVNLSDIALSDPSLRIVPGGSASRLETKLLVGGVLDDPAFTLERL